MGKARSRWFEVGVALLGAAAFAAVGPFRGAFTTLPEVLLVSALVLFMAPGALFTRWFLGEYFSGAASLPAAFVLSTGAFALLSVPMLILQSSLETYLRASGALVAASLLAAALVALRRERTAESGNTVSDRGGLMWVPFAALAAALAYICQLNAPSSYGDIWVYLAWIREYLGGGGLASTEPYFGEEVGLSRARINGWLAEQAALSRISGIDPVDLLFSYMNPALVVVALLAFYALARALFESEKAALFCGCLYALFFLVHLDATRLSFGGEFTQRLIEDKLAARFLFLPMALAFAAAFLKGGGRVYFLCFAFVCCAVMVVHPVGLAMIGISMAGFGILYLAFNVRSREAWGRVSAMGFAGLAVVGVPAVSVFVATGAPLTDVLADSDINSGDPDVLRNMIFVQPHRGRIFEFADGSYMMNPSLILDPAIAAAFLLGVPFLLWRLRRSMAAQLLLGTMLLTTALVYAPPVATFLGENVVLPGQIWRLAWPIPLAALLALGWLGWEVVSRAGAALGGFRPTRPLARALPLLLVAALAVAAVPQARSGVELIQSYKEETRSAGVEPADPIFHWLRNEAASPVVVLAPDVESARIPAFSSEANVVSRRGGLVLEVLPELEQRAGGPIEVPQGSLDVREFFGGTSLRNGVEILRRHDVDYVVVQSGSGLDRGLDDLPGFEPVSEPSERYNVYGVDLQTLDQLVGEPDA
ncbi:MAG: DUF6077 domain-containing protein [Rubrobacteraceae bacterium]